MTDAEARAEICRYGRLLWESRLVAGSSGNLSVRLDDGTLLVTPSGRALRNLEPDDLVAVDRAGSPLEPGRRATSELPLHLAAYRRRTDIACVVHTHPTYCTGWSKTSALFPLDTVGAIETLGPIAIAPYAPAGSAALAEACGEALRTADTVVMERHGISSVGATLEAAFLRSELAEQTAHIEFVARMLARSR